jgi:hypothetical protein
MTKHDTSTSKEPNAISNNWGMPDNQPKFAKQSDIMLEIYDNDGTVFFKGTLKEYNNGCFNWERVKDIDSNKVGGESADHSDKEIEIPESVNKSFKQNLCDHSFAIICEKCGLHNRDYDVEIKDPISKQQYIDNLKEKIKKIDVSGGGSGRRLKEQVLTLINDMKPENKEIK